jgi:hypothetical protein
MELRCEKRKEIPHIRRRKTLISHRVRHSSFGLERARHVDGEIPFSIQHPAKWEPLSFKANRHGTPLIEIPLIIQLIGSSTHF